MEACLARASFLAQVWSQKVAFEEIINLNMCRVTNVDSMPDQVRANFLVLDDGVVDLQHSLEWFDYMWRNDAIKTQDFIIIDMIFRKLMSAERDQMIEDNPLMPHIGSTPGNYTEMTTWLIEFGSLVYDGPLEDSNCEHITVDLTADGDWMTRDEVNELMNEPVHEWDLDFKE